MDVNSRRQLVEKLKLPSYYYLRHTLRQLGKKKEKKRLTDEASTKLDERYKVLLVSPTATCFMGYCFYTE